MNTRNTLISPCRYVSVNWDLEEVERKLKDKIVAGNALVEKLSIPA